MPPGILDFIGHLHGAIKVLPRRAEFFRRLEIGTQWALDNHLDIQDPEVQTALTAGAYQESLRAIFMQDNVVATTWSIAMNYLHNRGVAGQTIEAASSTMLPIIKVPTNIISETLAYNPANLGYQTIRLIQTLFDENRLGKSAMDNLSMHDMDNIMRGLKKGTVGLVLLTAGYALRDKVAGYYGKDPEDRKHLGTMKIGERKSPRFFRNRRRSPHSRWELRSATSGITTKSRGKVGGYCRGGICDSGCGTADTIYRILLVLWTRRGRRKSRRVFSGQLASSIAVPAAVQQVAKWTDPEGNEAADAGHPRKPTSAGEAVEMGIPGLRENVPLGGTQKRAKPSYRFPRAQK